MLSDDNEWGGEPLTTRPQDRPFLNRDPAARTMALALALPGLVLFLPGNQVPAFCSEYCEPFYAAAFLLAAIVLAFGDRFGETSPTPIRFDER